MTAWARMGAPGSVLIAMMCLAPAQPAMCWMAPLMPQEAPVNGRELRQASEVFVTNSVLGVMPVRSLSGGSWSAGAVWSAGPVSARVGAELARRLAAPDATPVPTGSASAVTRVGPS